MSDSSDISALPEIPWATSEAIESWRRILDQTKGDKRLNVVRAAEELLRLAKGQSDPAARQAIIDSLYEIAVRAGLDEDDTQAIIASAAEAPSDIRPINGAAHYGKITADTPLCFADIAAWAKHEPPAREWAVPDRFPLRNIALFSGEGSVGKSILLMQLAATHVLGKDWLGMLPEPGPALYFNAEDEETEIHRRLAAIAAHYGSSLADLHDHLHVLPLAGQDAVLGYPDRNGLIQATPLFHKLTEAARDIQPKLIGLDTSADIFAGNENDRSQVRQFIGLLRGMAIDANAAVIIAAHPSLTGINSGTGLSGTTAWHNSVRARAYMRAIKTEDGTEPDQSLRRIEFMKSNYGPIAESITLRWRDGVFVPVGSTGTFERLAAEANVDQAYLDCLDAVLGSGRQVGPYAGKAYAPAIFEKMAQAKGYRGKALAAAQERLFNGGRIEVVPVGPPSKALDRIFRRAVRKSPD